MAGKHDLRKQRLGTVINLTAKKQETALGRALKDVEKRLLEAFDVQLHHDPSWHLNDVIEKLKSEFPDVPFGTPLPTSTMKPDGGVLSIVDRDGRAYPILISEVKNQGTNDLRATEGLPPQSKGNAIERLGKNVIGFRTAMLAEGITPFICFGYGCDFANGSSILDRVLTIAMFGRLNELVVVNQGDGGLFNRGSFYFQEKQWTRQQMADRMYDVAERSIYYYFAKQGRESFARNA